MRERAVVDARIRYQVGGAWQGAVHAYQTVEVPGASHMDEGGVPAVPKDGLFVAVPDDARNVEVKVLEKKTQLIPGQIDLAPQAKHFVEEEFEEVFEPNPESYDKDDPYPGRDCDFLGRKTMEGAKVVHLIVDLGQYRPMSKKMEAVQSIALEVSYSTPTYTAREVARMPRRTVASDLVLGLELLDESSDFSLCR